MAAESRDAQQGNYNVDYVIRYSFAEGGIQSPHISSKTDGKAVDPQHATQQLDKLLKKLAEAGFLTEVRPGDKSSLLVFLRTTEKSLQRATHTSR